MKKRFLTILLLLAFTASAIAGSDSCTESWIRNLNTHIVGLELTCDGGNFTDTTQSEVYGWVSLVVVNPGTPAPTEQFDMTLSDEEGADLMGGALTDLNASITRQHMPLVDGTSWPRYVDGPISVTTTHNEEADAEFKVKILFPKE